MTNILQSRTAVENARRLLSQSTCHVNSDPTPRLEVAEEMHTTNLSQGMGALINARQVLAQSREATDQLLAGGGDAVSRDGGSDGEDRPGADHLCSGSLNDIDCTSATSACLVQDKQKGGDGQSPTPRMSQPPLSASAVTTADTTEDARPEVSRAGLLASLDTLQQGLGRSDGRAGDEQGDAEWHESGPDYCGPNVLARFGAGDLQEDTPCHQTLRLSYHDSTSRVDPSSSPLPTTVMDQGTGMADLLADLDRLQEHLSGDRTRPVSNRERAMANGSSASPTADEPFGSMAPHGPPTEPSSCTAHERRLTHVGSGRSVPSESVPRGCLPRGQLSCVGACGSTAERTDGEEARLLTVGGAATSDGAGEYGMATGLGAAAIAGSWIARESRSRPGHFFWFNDATGETTWRLGSPQRKSSAHPAPAQPRERVCKSGGPPTLTPQHNLPPPEHATRVHPLAASRDDRTSRQAMYSGQSRGAVKALGAVERFAAAPHRRGPNYCPACWARSSTSRRTFTGSAASGCGVV